MGYKVTHVNLICNNPDCKRSFKISMDAYKRKRNKDRVWKCNTCSLSERGKMQWENKSKSEKGIISDRMKILTRQTWDNMSDDTKMKRSEKISNARIEYEKNLSEKDKFIRSQRARHQMIEMLEKDPSLRNKLISQLDGYTKSMTPDQKVQNYNKVSKGLSDYWANMSPEQYQELSKKRSISFNKYLESLRYTGPNKNESMLLELLSGIGVHHKFHHYNQFLHPEFKKLFPINPVTNSSRVSGYHQWDFIVYTRRNISFIDVDGSIHDPDKTNYVVTDWSGNKFILGDMISFYESQRPYQTDGMDAYVVQCYDDNIISDTPVLCLHDNTTITVMELLMNLYIQNMSDNEIEESLKSID